jgi:adipocyte plasma membrane-associated protein
MKLLNDLDFDGDFIYFIDSSYERTVNEAAEEHLEIQPRGRLFRINEKTNELEFILDNLYFPNGLQLTPDKKVALINENSMSRILKYHLSGDKKGRREVFADIPGAGDTIRLSSKNTLLVPFVSVRNPNTLSLMDTLSTHPWIRTALFMVNFNYFNLTFSFLIL